MSAQGATEPAPIGSLDWETFEAKWSTIAIASRTIRGAKGKTRRQFRLMEVYETASGELVGEILPTTCGPVVLAWGAELDMTRSAHGGITYDYRLARGVDRWALQPFTGDAQELYWLRSHSKRYTLLGEYFAARNYPETAAFSTKIIDWPARPSKFCCTSFCTVASSGQTMIIGPLPASQALPGPLPFASRRCAPSATFLRPVGLFNSLASFGMTTSRFA